MSRRGAVSAAACRPSGLLVIGVPCLLLLIALWLPFGFSMGGLIEEWDLRSLFTVHGVFYRVHLDGPLASNIARPLMPMVFALAHQLSPDSFVGFHVVIFAALLVKACAWGDMVRRTTLSTAFALAAALLLLVYPADTMQMALRSIHIHVAGALALLGGAFCLRALLPETPEADCGPMGWAWSLAGSLAFLVACAIYEAALPLWIAPLLLAWSRLGTRGLLTVARLRAKVLSLWLLAPALYVGFAMWAAHAVPTYQGGLVGHLSVNTLWANFVLPWFSIGATQALVTGWYDALRMFRDEFAAPAFPFMIGLAAAFMVWWVSRLERASRLRTISDSESTASSWSSGGPGASGLTLRLLVSAVLTMLAGYAPFLVSPAHVAISQRTFIWASVGASLLWIVLLAIVSRRSRILSLAAFAMLILLGSSSQLFQFHHYDRLWNAQRHIARQIVEQFDGDLRGRTLIVIDGSEQAGHTWLFSADEPHKADQLYYALTYLYGKPLGHFEICHENSMEWQRWDGLARKGRCSQEADGWHFEYKPGVTGPGGFALPAKPGIFVANTDAVVVRITEPHAVSPGADPIRRNALAQGQDPAARRYRSQLLPSDWLVRWRLFRDQRTQDGFRWDFGRYWSMELPHVGSGWREANWVSDWPAHRSLAWKNSETSTLFFDMQPRHALYMLRGRIRSLAPAVAAREMRVKINGHLVEIGWTGEGKFEGAVSLAALVSGRNRLEVQLPLDTAYYGLSAEFDWIELKPFR